MSDINTGGDPGMTAVAEPVTAAGTFAGTSAGTSAASAVVGGATPAAAAAIAPAAASARAAVNRQRRRNRKRDFAIAFMVNTLPFAGFLIVLWSIASGESPHLFDVMLFAVSYVLGMIGLEVGYHRYFAHKAFRTYRWFEVLLAILGSTNFQGGVIWWTATDRRHHAHSDTEQDPHSPVVATGSGLNRRLKGLVHAYIGWMFDHKRLRPLGWDRLVATMFRDPVLFRIHIGYWKWGVAGLLLPTLAGGLWYQSWAGAWSGFLWGGLLRLFVTNQMMYLTNSLGHTLGSRMFRRRDHSRNNILLAPLSFGLSLHNNHHAFPHAASLRFRWWQVDLAGVLIFLLEKIGIVWDVWRVDKKIMRERARATESGDAALKH